MNRVTQFPTVSRGSSNILETGVSCSICFNTRDLLIPMMMMMSLMLKCPQMSVDILGTSCDNAEAGGVNKSLCPRKPEVLVRTDSPGRPPRLSHSS